MSDEAEKALAAFTEGLRGPFVMEKVTPKILQNRDKELIDAAKSFLSKLASEATRSTGATWRLSCGYPTFNLDNKYSDIEVQAFRNGVKFGSMSIRFLEYVGSVVDDTYVPFDRSLPSLYGALATAFQRMVIRAG